MAEGTWRGIKTHPSVKEPHLVVEEEYETVRYGWLAYFALYVPIDSTVKKATRGNRIYILIETTTGKYAYKILGGSAEYPAEGYSVPIEEVEKVFEEEKVIEEAKAVF
jgi:hypothetical protein